MRWCGVGKELPPPPLCASWAMCMARFELTGSVLLVGAELLGSEFWWVSNMRSWLEGTVILNEHTGHV